MKSVFCSAARRTNVAPEHTRLEAALVSKKRIGLNLAGISPMGFVSLTPWIGAAVARSDPPTDMKLSARRPRGRMLRRAVNRIEERIFGHHGRDGDEKRRVRRELVVANFSVALQGGMKGW